MSQPIRIGEILVEQGVMTAQQVFEVLQAQKKVKLPFGVLAERMFEVTVQSIKNAWVEQYQRLTGTIDLAEQKFDEEALRAISKRQAWQFEMLPIAYDDQGELLIAASRTRMARAVTFATNRLDRPAFFRVAESQQLREFLQKHYPMPEVSEELLAKSKELAAEA